MYQYSTSGYVQNIEFDIVDNKVVNVRFLGGCNETCKGYQD